MPTGVLQDVDRRVSPAQSSRVSATQAAESPVNHDIDVASAQLPSRRLGLSRSSLRIGLKVTDGLVAAAIVGWFLIYSGTGILSNRPFLSRYSMISLAFSSVSPLFY